MQGCNEEERGEIGEGKKGKFTKFLKEEGKKSTAARGEVGSMELVGVKRVKGQCGMCGGKMRWDFCFFLVKVCVWEKQNFVECFLCCFFADGMGFSFIDGV